MEQQTSTPVKTKFKLGDLVRTSSCLAYTAYTIWEGAPHRPYYQKDINYDLRLKLTNTDIGIISLVGLPYLSASNYYKVHFLQSNVTMILPERQLKWAKQEKAIMFD